MTSSKFFFFTSIFFFLSQASFSQINFESGYFIGDDDKRVECLIKNNDWRETPDEFSFKLTEQGELEKKDY